MNLLTDPRRWLKRAHASKAELGTLAGLLAGAVLAFVFAAIANQMVEGETRAFDTAVINALRNPADRADPIGPRWFEESVRDITSLGSNTVLTIIVVGVAGFLAVSGAQRTALLIAFSISSGTLVVQLLKDFFGRVRPDLVAHSATEVARSFPSGHAMMAAVTYLTLGALLARVQPRPILRVYLLLLAIFLTMLVGLSRVYLGVHWPTDVLAGWSLGSLWALGTWFLAIRLQREGQVEKRIDG